MAAGSGSEQIHPLIGRAGGRLERCDRSAGGIQLVDHEVEICHVVRSVEVESRILRAVGQVNRVIEGAALGTRPRVTSRATHRGVGLQHSRGETGGAERDVAIPTRRDGHVDRSIGAGAGDERGSDQPSEGDR